MTSRLRKGSMFKMAATKVTIMNVLGRTEGSKKSREQRYKEQETALDKRRKADEESLRVKSVTDAIRREKMADLDRNFQEISEKYSVKKNVRY
jgi:hypothetical protein